jgi:hypothetical protein
MMLRLIRWWLALMVLVACGGASSRPAPAPDPAAAPLPKVECEHVIGHFIDVAIRSTVASEPAKAEAKSNHRVIEARAKLMDLCESGGVTQGLADCFLESFDRDELDRCAREAARTSHPRPR